MAVARYIMPPFLSQYHFSDTTNHGIMRVHWIWLQAWPIAVIPLVLKLEYPERSKSILCLLLPWARLNIKTIFPRYGDPHVKDKTVVRPSYFQHGDPYTGKTTSLYWDGPQGPSIIRLSGTFLRCHPRIPWNTMVKLLCMHSQSWLSNWY